MCRICALAVDPILSPSLGIRWCKKKCKTWANLWIWSFPSSISCDSFQLSLDCEVGACIQVTVCSGFWKSYTTSVIKQHFYFGHQKTLHSSELYITACCVKRMWRGLHFLWVTPWFFCWKTEANIAIPAPCLWWVIMESFSGEKHFFHGAFSFLEPSWNPGHFCHLSSYAV